MFSLFLSLFPPVLFSLPITTPPHSLLLHLLQVAPNGLHVSFLGGFEGVVSSRHLPDASLSTEKYRVGKKLKARLLWTNPLEKTAGLTLQRSIVAGTTIDTSGLKIGDKFQGRACSNSEISSCCFTLVCSDSRSICKFFSAFKIGICFLHCFIFVS